MSDYGDIRYQLRSPAMYGIARRVWMYQRVEEGYSPDDNEWRFVVGDPVNDLELLGLAVEEAVGTIRGLLAPRLGRKRAIREALIRLENEARLIRSTTGSAP